ncbi:Copii coat assembly protein sec16 protein [Thalictrum thalictroides]|uniref:Copii coat assembly protein sec16 protein n=1 Tax=Thalictrum thalictroides TaxID=46969 RepID=A0A7J6WCY3_THATH|nr:Copii coat assembly protein sec16 protein [Thalictrum thalictroides]
MNSQSLVPTSLRRRNSMVSPIVPFDLDIPNKKQSSSFPSTNDDKSSFPTVDFELISLKSLAYTSLRDILPSLSAVQSPTGCNTQSMYEIPIRNHLVKQAAWAYLQPMSASPGSSNRYSFRRMWTRFSTDYVRNPFKACFGFIRRRVLPMITQVFDRFLGAIQIRINTRR